MPDDSSPRSNASSLPAASPRPHQNGDNLFERIMRAFGWKPPTARAELEEVLEEGAPAAETGFTPEEQAMLKNILSLRERRIEDVMLPRADIIAVQQDISLGDLMRVFENAGHSRLVVYNETLDDPQGMVHIRDLIAFMTAHAAVKPGTKTRRKKPLSAGLDLSAIDLSIPLSSTDIVRALLFVPPSMLAIDLLARMQATRIHLALVIDEYGGTDGLVSIEDLVELIVGDIADEHDIEEAPGVLRQLDGSFIVDARANLEEVTNTIGEEFDIGDAGEDVDTFGGYVVTKVGRVPVRGEFVSGPGQFEIEILDADPRRVKKVRVYPSRQHRLESRRESRRRDGLPSVAHAPATSASEPAAAEGEAPQKDTRQP
jgi:CBS domain containing-hemolysin-like protein